MYRLYTTTKLIIDPKLIIARWQWRKRLRQELHPLCSIQSNAYQSKVVEVPSKDRTEQRSHRVLIAIPSMRMVWRPTSQQFAWHSGDIWIGSRYGGYGFELTDHYRASLWWNQSTSLRFQCRFCLKPSISDLHQSDLSQLIVLNHGSISRLISEYWNENRSNFIFLSSNNFWIPGTPRSVSSCTDPMPPWAMNRDKFSWAEN